KAWITSEYAQTQTMTYLTLIFLAFFVAIGAGMTLLRDRESKVDPLLHATPLSAGEYVWGRFAALVLGFAILLCFYGAAAAFFNHAVPSAAAKEIRGPFAAGNYLVPVLAVGLPFVIFFGGLSLYVGERTRNAVLVFVLPVATLLVCGFFLWTWAPSWLDLGVNRLFQVIEPSGYRWLNETHLKVDRGVAYYNREHVGFDLLFWLNRAWVLAAGLGAVALTQRSVARAARGTERSRGAARRAGTGDATAAASPEIGLEIAASATGRGALGTAGGAPGFWASALGIARAELVQLARQPGLYIFVPIILIQALGSALTAVGPFDTPLLMTPGMNAVATARQVTLMVCLLLTFYTVESLERERTTGIAAILYASPLRTGALLLGKWIANLAIIAGILGSALVAGAITLAVQGQVPFDVGPYAVVWGLLLLPTYLVWMAFVTFLYAATGNRYGAYGLALGALIFTFYHLIAGNLTWATNWWLWSALRWTDLGFFETDLKALIWNRVLVSGLTVLFGVLAVRLFGRSDQDAVRAVHQLAPRRLLAAGGRLLPVAAVPIVAFVTLSFMVHGAVDGEAAKKEQKDYWAKNLKTWMRAPLPDIARADVGLRIDPAKHWLASEGTVTLVNPHEAPLAKIPLTGGLHWDSLTWTMNGAPYAPEDRKRLYVFTPAAPLARGDSVVIGWRWNGRYPGGVTKNGGSTSEFVLPSGVVLTGFSPSFMPVIGFQEDVGESKENRTEPREYPSDYWKGETRGAFGATAWFHARVTITAPEEYTLNSAGICVRNTVEKSWRTQVWETDHPIKLLNVVCGRWKTKQGEGTTIYHAAAHPYNIEEMSATLDAARRWYSEWFLPYPWKELKLSEFPGLAGYAQGFGTNITFSENIGFLTKNDEKTNATFLVTAHEAAHQWWGNILTPADGPGGDILSEGMSHFSTLLLFEKVKGARARMEFAKGIEARYGDRRRPDDERPMYEIDGKRESDETLTYDRGGWVFWMLYDFLGHERALEGYRNFIRTWSAGRDHPALQDFVAAMRPYAPDAAAYDAFTEQWFAGKAMPEYRVTSASKKAAAGGGYEVMATVENRGTGTMPVEIAAAAGERWAKEKNDYRDARATALLGPGAEATVSIRCDFEPKTVVVDPDVRVLQLNRKLAAKTL
ncbi:MAG TPA: M1 family aminopeptidase, partial [Candidatus Eisenbacteria bacterium]|nr:M1 family aminopeptidase [Candidatus Eisenbacteria bacterium]